MRTQREQTAKADSHGQRRLGPGRRPVAPGTPAAALLALQRTAGNAAVARAIREQRQPTEEAPRQRGGEPRHTKEDSRPTGARGQDAEEHGQGPEGQGQPADGHGQGAERHGPHVDVQRSAVHAVLRSPGRPLNAPLRTEMEARLGADFSDVRVHDDRDAHRSAAEIGASAYTSGSHVVLGEQGADPHTLAHELTHVIQQRQGSVSGTDNGSGLRVSDPSDRFEQAAEANARRVMSGAPPAVAGVPPAMFGAHHAPGETEHTDDAPEASAARPEPVQRMFKKLRGKLKRKKREPKDQDHGQQQEASGSQQQAGELREETDQPEEEAAETQVEVGELEEGDYDGLHTHPSGPALRVHGPGSPDTAPNRITDSWWWNQLPEEQGGNQHVDLHQDPQTLKGQNPYLYSVISSGLAGRPTGMDKDKFLEDKGLQDPVTAGYWQRQGQRDRMLAGQAAKQVTEQSRRPPVEEVNDRLAAAQPGPDGQPTAATEISALLEKYDGVILSAAHSKSWTWGFIVDNMAMLKQQDVRTIYLESIRDDAFQPMVDAYVRQATAEMPSELDSFVKKYDEHWKLGDRGLRSLLEAARQHDLEVKGVDGRPARTLKAEGLNGEEAAKDSGYLRAGLMNTYAAQVVRRRQERPGAGKYLMELGTAHSITHSARPHAVTAYEAELDGPVPGLSDILGVPPMYLATPDGREPDHADLKDLDPVPHDNLRLHQRPTLHTAQEQAAT